MIINHKILISVLCFTLTLSFASAQELDEREELLGIKNTIVNLIDELVNAGVLDESKADLMKQRAAAKAKLQAAEEAEEEAQVAAQQKAADEDAVRVQYVPEHVKEEIREQVRTELKDEVVAEVMDDAKNHILGVPDLLPDWVKNLRISGDARIRQQTEVFTVSDADLDNDNDGFRDVEGDFLALNEAQQNIQTAAVTAQDPNQFFKERDRTRNQLRKRLRLGISTDVNENIKVGMRITTGDIFNPVSVNQTLGNDGRRLDLQLDRIFIRYTGFNESGYDWIQMWTGRFKNPFFSTDMSFDEDLSFEGVAMRLKHDMGSSLGSGDTNQTFFLTAGAFPLDEISFRSEDKWLFGGQFGSELLLSNNDRFKFAVSYYDYVDIRGERNVAQNGAGTRVTFQANDYTAPTFLQGGNTLFDIRNDFDTVNPLIPIDTALYGLASDFNVMNLTASYDWAGLAPIHLIFTGDIAYNFGYNEDEIVDRISAGGNGVAQVYQSVVLNDAVNELDGQTLAYHFRLTAGWPRVVDQGQWHVFGGYKYLQRDSVLDAFTESNLGLGGTNVKGFIIGGRYAIFDNTYFQGRWISSDSIDGPDIGIDVIAFDVNASF